MVVKKDKNSPFIELSKLKKELNGLGNKHVVYMIWSYDKNGRRIVSGDYIGTNTGALYRPQDHFRSAKDKVVTAAMTGNLGQGKLHDLLFATGPGTWMVDILYVADSKKEAELMENFFQHYFDSVRNGLNKKYAPINHTPHAKMGSITFQGEKYSYTSYSDLSRQFNISVNTLRHHLKNKSLTKALQAAIAAAKETSLREPIIVGRRPYDSIEIALADKKHANKHNLTRSNLKKRRREGMSWHEAFSEPAGKRRSVKVTVKIDGRNRTFESVAEAHKIFVAEGFTYLPAYSTVIARIERGLTPTQAFGFSKQHWEKRWEKADKLIAEKGYSLVGKRSHEGNPLVLHETREVFASARAFAAEFFYEYTMTAEQLKKLSPAQLLLKKKHPITNGWETKKPRTQRTSA